MDKGIYTALSGGIAKSHELELIANNLANANTPGFKRDTGTFNEYLTSLRRPDSVDGLQRELRSLTSPDARPAGRQELRRNGRRLYGFSTRDSGENRASA